MTETASPKAPAATDVVLRVAGLTKRFGATLALDKADLALRHGTVHALVGGNGCGKSTTIKVLAGVHRGDEGRIEVAGTAWDVDAYDPRAGRAAGLRFVHQDLGLFPQLSIAENFAFDAGYPTGPGGRVQWRNLHRRVAELLTTYEIDADPRTPVGALRPAQRTLVAICRALQDQEGDERLILILDEPTATLPQHESDVLLEAVRRRADQGQTVMMVSHRMPEVLSVCDDFTVFRDGRTVAALVGQRPTEHELVRHMTGAALARTIDESVVPGALDGDTPVPADDRPAAEPATAAADDDVVLRVQDLHGGPLRGVDLELRRGEIVGVAGLVGSGRSSLLRTIFGEHRPASGRVTVRDAAGRVHADGDPRTRMEAGVAMVPEDRAGEAAFAELTIRDNLSVTVRRKYWRLWGMSQRQERADAADLVARYGVRAASADAPFTSLSGGNQQKVVLARWLQRQPSLLLLDEPTQGVDVMSRADIYRTVQEAAAGGCTVLVASSDLLELCSLCERVIVLQDGRVAAHVSGAQLTPDHLTVLTQSTTEPPSPTLQGASR
ncbi:sugar ABC transporter ATP-binding protein [Geodermatophilus sabuli]|uniref:Sugar ABC transporter ATP-binding protein n=1 Tax=Geodermatophilus sabuli TaxID=1564158 RepID=A0A7K3VWR9_9ACTN|nr:sugar ABC transporter ATP-binding protein [Geodermatophilus sabuli]NEK56778.1 sugar ABC transporter ATP-binding protein [Geodermatophilus sabuli]